MTRDEETIAKQADTIESLRRRWDDLDRTNSRLAEHNSRMIAYIMSLCKGLEEKGIKIEYLGSDNYTVTYVVKCSSRVEALEKAEALAHALDGGS